MQVYRWINEMPDENETDELVPAPSPAKRSGIGLRCVLLGLVLNALAAGLMSMLLCCAPGSAIRPMGHACYLFLFVAIGLFAGFPMSILAVFREKGSQKWLGVLGMLLNLAVFPAGCWTLRFLAYVMNLTLET